MWRRRPALLLSCTLETTGTGASQHEHVHVCAAREEEKTTRECVSARGLFLSQNSLAGTGRKKHLEFPTVPVCGAPPGCE